VSLLGDVGTSMVTRDDCARAVVAALGGASKSRTLEIAGPCEVRVHHLAILLSALAGAPVRHRAVSRDALRQQLACEGVPTAVAEQTIALQLAIASGAYEGDSDDFTLLTGRVPTSLVGFLMFHADDAREWAKGASAWKRVS
jgi:NAD(P)H dehydrogenase (quinone)